MSIYSMAIELEDIVRRNGAVPATIGIIDGRVHIGELCVVHMRSVRAGHLRDY